MRLTLISEQMLHKTGAILVLILSDPFLRGRVRIPLRVTGNIELTSKDQRVQYLLKYLCSVVLTVWHLF